MFFFNKKSIVRQGIFTDFTDNHSHILYGVDDGVRTRNESLAILKRYEEYGVKEVWLTPHIQEYMPNETCELKERYEELLAAYDGNIKLHLAAEYMMDTLFTDRLADNDLLYHGSEGKRLLVETSYFNPPLGMDDTLKAIFDKGITPILAHPERYNYMDDDTYARLYDQGIIFQLNLASLTGMYGESAKRKAYALLERGYYTLYGTDIHSKKMLEVFEEKRIKTIKTP